MLTCLICPVPDLEKFVDRGATHHLMLAHLFDVPGYVEFYRKRSESFDDYVIVDNGAKENGRGLGLKRVLELGSRVHAKEVVLSDVRYKGPETIWSGHTDLEWLKTREGRRAYRDAGQPRLMIVPQGANLSNWEYCLRELLQMTMKALDTITDSYEPPVVGAAYHYDHLFEGGIDTILSSPAIAGQTIHMLGWPRALTPLRDAAKKHDIRTVDSSRPFVYGKHGLECHSGYPDYAANPYPSRDEAFFTEPIPDEHSDVVKDNIRKFRSWAMDIAGRSRCIECGSEALTVRNHSMMWHDGDVYCPNGHYVRMYDAG